MKRLVLVAVVGTALLAACSSSGSDKSSSTTASTGSAAKPASVKVGKVKLGPVATNSDGRTLYYFESDKGTTSACTPVAACASNWPVVKVGASPTGGPGITTSQLGVAPDGQLTYYGHLMYTFAGDSAAGQANGVGIPKWYPISPKGKEVEAEGS